MSSIERVVGMCPVAQMRMKSGYVRPLKEGQRVGFASAPDIINTGLDWFCAKNGLFSPLIPSCPA